MTAMHQATEAANDMVNELTLFYNKARQAAYHRRDCGNFGPVANALAEMNQSQNVTYKFKYRKVLTQRLSK